MHTTERGLVTIAVVGLLVCDSKHGWIPLAPSIANQLYSCVVEFVVLQAVESYQAAGGAELRISHESEFAPGVDPGSM